MFKYMIPLFLMTLTANAQFGAIAYSPKTGVFGISWAQPNVASADFQARKMCELSSCQTVVWVKNAYAALAVNPNTFEIYGWGWSTQTVVAAQNTAYSQCMLRSNIPCVIWATLASQ